MHKLSIEALVQFTGCERPLTPTGLTRSALLAEASPQRLLIVDDEPELAELVRETLEAAGYEVASAESGAIALALLMEARFDAIVSDLRMPGFDGTELWRAVQASHPLQA